jgi:hypothetical protein
VKKWNTTPFLAESNVPVIVGGLTLSKAFDLAFTLLKESASKWEYRQNPHDEPGGFGAQDWELNPSAMPDDSTGVARLFPNRWWYGPERGEMPNQYKAHSSSRVQPSIGRKTKAMLADGGSLPDNFDEKAIQYLSRVGSHESMHQAMHGVKPEMVNQSVIGHETGAVLGEFKDWSDIRERMRWLKSHPRIGESSQRQIQEVLDALLDKNPEEQAQIMGHRARGNAMNQMSMQTELERLQAAEKEMEAEIDEVEREIYQSKRTIQSFDDDENWEADQENQERLREVYNRYQEIGGQIMDIERKIIKAPLFYPGEDWGDMDDPDYAGPTEGGASAQERENFPDLMSDLMLPAGFSDVSWESGDGMARGVAQLNWDTGQVNVHHFEVATPVRNSGLGESYLREMIDEIEQEFAGQPIPYNHKTHAHATRVEPEKAGFWDKMVDRGAIHSASSRSNPRVTVDGKHFAPKISSDKLQPWEWLTEDDI